MSRVNPTKLADSGTQVEKPRVRVVKEQYTETELKSPHEEDLTDGFPLSMFVEPDQTKSLVCAICTDVVNRACSTPCHHLFCKNCILPALAQKERCPVCRSPCQTDSLYVNGVLDRMVGELNAFCPKKEHGCTWTGSKSDIVSHLSRCSYVEQVCYLCEQPLMKTELLNHHFTTCRFRRVKCERCQKPYIHNDRALHVARCGARIVNCPNDCGIEDLTANDLQSHIDGECPLQHVPCPIMKITNGASLLQHESCAGGSLARQKIRGHLVDRVDAHLHMTARALQSRDNRINELEQRVALLELEATNQHDVLQIMQTSLTHLQRTMRALQLQVHSDEQKQLSNDLCKAAFAGEHKICEALLQKRADPNQADKNKRLPLHLSARKGYSETLKLLIRSKAEVNMMDEEGMTAIIRASNNGHDQCVRELLGFGSSVDVRDSWGRTSLMIAAEHGRVSTVSLLLSQNARVNNMDHTGATALHKATEWDRCEVIQHLVKAKSDLEARDNWGQTPLMKACMAGRIDAVQAMIDLGAKLDSKDSIYGRDALLVAAEARNTGSAKILIQNKANIDVKDSNGKSVLMIAAESENQALLNELLRQGVNIDSTDKSGETAAMKAIHSEQICRQLIGANADCTIRSKTGQTLLGLIEAQRRSDLLAYAKEAIALASNEN